LPRCGGLWCERPIVCRLRKQHVRADPRVLAFYQHAAAAAATAGGRGAGDTAAASGGGAAGGDCVHESGAREKLGGASVVPMGGGMAQFFQA
jgi:hypothetical protein